MKLQKSILLLSVLALASAMPAFAQVEKAAIRTTGISCGTCAAFAELYLRQLAGIDKVTISRSNEAVMVSYKPGASFQPKDLRDVLKKTDVSVVQLQIGARGRAQEQGGKRYFVAGKDKFVLVEGAKTPQIPRDTMVSVEGIVNDRSDPMQLTVMTVKPVKE